MARFRRGVTRRDPPKSHKDTVIPVAANLDAAAIGSGLIADARLGSGTPDSTKFLRGDRTWSAVSGSGTPVASSTVTGTVKVNTDDSGNDPVVYRKSEVDTLLSALERKYPLKPPASPSAEDDEFPGSSLDAKWSWLNQGTAAVTIKDGTLQLDAPSATENVRALIQPVPGGNWNIEAYFSIGGPLANYWGAGLLVYNSANGKLEVFERGHNSGNNTGVHRYNSVTSYSSTLASSTSLAGTILGWGPAFMRLVYDGTNVSYQASANGKTWFVLTTSTVSGFLGGITDFGLFIKQSGSGGNASLVNYYFRRT